MFPLAVLFVALFAIYRADGDVRRADLDLARANDARRGLTRVRDALREAAGSDFGAGPVELTAL